MAKKNTSRMLHEYAVKDDPNKKPHHTSAETRTRWALCTLTGLPPLHPSPESWMEWGTPVSINDAEEGDTVILKAAGKFIVGLFHAWGEDNTLKILCTQPGPATFPKTAVRGIRRLLI